MALVNSLSSKAKREALVTNPQEKAEMWLDKFVHEFEESVITALNLRTRRTPAHVNFSRLAQDLSHRVRLHVSLTSSAACRTRLRCCFLEHYLSFHLHSKSDLLLDRLPDLSSSHGDLPCADPSNLSFGPMTETTSPPGRAAVPECVSDVGDIPTFAAGDNGAPAHLCPEFPKVHSFFDICMYKYKWTFWR